MNFALTLNKVRKFLLVATFVAVGFGIGYFAGSKNIKTPGELVNVTVSRDLPAEHQDLDFNLFWKVWDTLSVSYYDKSKLDQSEMVYGAIKGMVSAVGDPYTVFLPPDENKVVEEDLQGSFEGVGIQIGFKGTRLAVIAPLPGSPAERAGVQSGDLIVAIKDEAKNIDRSTDGISLPEAVEAIRGPAKSKVTLALLREEADRPLVVEVERENIDVPSVTLSYAGPNDSIAHLKVFKFSSETSREWADSINKIASNPNIKGVVVDLRNNPGGYLESAVDLASEFLKAGSVVVVEDNGSMKHEDKVTRVGKLLNMPVSVLINKGSASASEILAGALRDNLQAKLVGDVSFGKGTVQEPIDLSGGANVHVTTSKWLTPSGYWVHEKGLEPDVKVEDNMDTPADEQLEAAVKTLAP